MSGDKYLIDTNIVIAIFAGEESVLAEIAKDIEVYTVSVVVGELYYGASKSSKVIDNKSRIEHFCTLTTVLDVTEITAKYYGNIKFLLQKKGRPIPENDIWIAAIAMEYGLTLVTRDKHFDQIDGLDCVEW